MGGLNTVNVIIPVVVALSPLFIGNYRVPGIPKPFDSVVFGALVALAAYAAYKVFASREGYIVEKSMILGLLVAKLLVFQRFTEFPSFAGISLFLFLFFSSLEHI